MTNTREKLPIAKILVGAFAFPWRQRQAFVKALAIPALALVALILATAAVYFLNLASQGVSVLGDIPAGLPTVHLPQVGVIETGRR